MFYDAPILKVLGMGLLLSPWMYSCEESLPLPMEDEIAPEVMIYSPLEGTNYTVNDPINVEIDVAENAELHFVSVKLVSEKFDTLYWNYYEHDHSRSISVREQIQLEPLETQKYLMLVEADDHNGNRSSSLISYSIRL